MDYKHIMDDAKKKHEQTMKRVELDCDSFFQLSKEQQQRLIDEQRKGE